MLGKPVRSARVGQAPTRSEHGVQQQDPSIGDVLGQLVVKQLGRRGLLVPLDEDLADSHRTAAVPQALLHGLASAHDGHAADLALKLKAIVRLPNRRGHRLLNHGQVVQSLLDEKTNNAVRVENEVGPLRVLISDHAATRDVSRARGRTGHCRAGAGATCHVPSRPLPLRGSTHVSSAMSWGVCGSVMTFSYSTSVETVAVGFWLSAR